MRLLSILVLVLLVVSILAAESTPKKKAPKSWSFKRMRCAFADKVLVISRRIKLWMKCEQAFPTQEKPKPAKLAPKGAVAKTKPKVADLARDAPPIPGTFTEYLYKHLAVDDRDTHNMAVSPLSIEVVLAAVGLGASGDTQQEIYRVLQVDKDTFAVKYRNKISELDLKNQKSLKMATRIYLEKTFFEVEDKLKTTMENILETQIEPANFVTGSDDEIKRINEFVEDKTEKNIQDAVTKDDINPAVHILLLNTLFFKGLWENQFQKEQGFNGDFHLPNNQQVKATYMTRDDTYGYYKVVPEGKFRMLELPYLKNQVSGQFSMIIILPDEIEGLPSVENFLTKDDTWLKDFNLKSYTQTARIKPTIPRFTIDIRIDLKKTLNKMGVSTMFEDSADFRGISKKKELKVTNLQQRVFIDVDEKGTKAAAATSASTAEIKDFDENEIIEFNANHPFAFALIQRSTKTVLFMGHVVKPNYDELFAAQVDDGGDEDTAKKDKDRAFELYLMNQGPKPS